MPNNIKRSSFRLGEEFKTELQPIKPALPKGKREQDIRGRIRRPGFKVEAPQPKPFRTIKDIQDLRTKQQGIKIRFGDEKLGKLRIKKRDKDGKIILDNSGNPIFENKEFNVNVLADILQGSSTDNITRLNQINTLITSGARRSTQDINNISAIAMNILSNTQELGTLGVAQITSLQRALMQLGISRDPIEAGIPSLINGRFINTITWERDNGINKGLIYMFLIANARQNPNLSASRPIFGFSDNAITLATINSVMRGTARIPLPVMDLVGKRLYRNLADAQNNVFGATEEVKIQVEEELKRGFPPIIAPPTGFAPIQIPRQFTGLPEGEEGETPFERIVRQRIEQRRVEVAPRALVPTSRRLVQPGLEVLSEFDLE